PPLYRLSHSGKILYARDDKHRDELIKREFHGNAKVEIGRFKGLGEMLASQLKETTMAPQKRTLLRVVVVAEDRKKTDSSVERLMGNKPEARFEFIQERAEFVDEGALAVGTALSRLCTGALRREGLKSPTTQSEMRANCGANRAGSRGVAPMINFVRIAGLAFLLAGAAIVPSNAQTPTALSGQVTSGEE